MNLKRPLFRQLFPDVFRKCIPFLFAVLAIPAYSQSQELSASTVAPVIIKGAPLDTTSLNRVLQLINEVQPSTYYLNNTQKKYGDRPICLFTDPKALQSGPNISDADDIEIVIIKISDQNDVGQKMELSGFAGFPKLKYIYIITEIAVSEQIIVQMLQNISPTWTVLHANIKPS